MAFPRCWTMSWGKRYDADGCYPKVWSPALCFATAIPTVSVPAAHFVTVLNKFTKLWLPQQPQEFQDITEFQICEFFGLPEISDSCAHNTKARFRRKKIFHYSRHLPSPEYLNLFFFFWIYNCTVLALTLANLSHWNVLTDWTYKFQTCRGKKIWTNLCHITIIIIIANFDINDGILECSANFNTQIPSQQTGQIWFADSGCTEQHQSTTLQQCL